MSNVPRQIIVHHSAADTPDPQFAAINEWHRQRDFPKSKLGFYVGYHWVIEKDGSTARARFDQEIGAHTIGQNDKSIGICLVGNFDKSSPTERQKTSLGILLSMYCDLYKLDENDIHPHRKYAEKSCYGKKLGDYWAPMMYLEHKILEYQVRLENLPEY